MESIISMHDEVYPLKSRCNKFSSSYLSNHHHIKLNTLNNKTNIFSSLYQCIKKLIAHRTLYILAIFNLILAGVAIFCVAHAEDHPEYFSLVYISISIFIFYMSTIIFIIIIQIMETYQKNPSSSSMQMPLVTSQIPIPSNPIPLETMITKTRLSRSQTLPLPSSVIAINPHQTLSTSTSSLTPKDSNQIPSTQLALLPKTYPSIKNYQSFALTTTDHSCPLCTSITNSDNTPHLTSLIKPIPFKYHVNNENNKHKVSFLRY